MSSINRSFDSNRYISVSPDADLARALELSTLVPSGSHSSSSSRSHSSSSSGNIRREEADLEAELLAEAIRASLEHEGRSSSAPQPKRHRPSFSHKSSLGSEALAEVRRLTAILEDQSSNADKVALQRELFEILSGTGDASKRVGSVAGSVTDIPSDGLPFTGHIPGGPAANQTAWEHGDRGYIPTNDWFQGIAGFPGQPAHMNSTGPYMMEWSRDGNSIRFKIPNGFSVHGTNQPYLLENLDASFKIGAADCRGKPVVRWQNTGNMARDVSYNDGRFVIHAVQGGLFQGASYNGTTPELSVPAGGKMEVTKMPGGIVKYEISAHNRKYFIYGNEHLKLSYDPATGHLTSHGHYKGSINMTSLDLRDPKIDDNELILDIYANSVIVKAQGTLLPDNQCQFAYVCKDLHGNPTDNQPLVLLKHHHSTGLRGMQSTDLSVNTLTGKMKAYVGSNYVFDVPSPSDSANPLDPLPSHGNGREALTVAQAKAMISDQSHNGIDYALRKAGDLNSGNALYNKSIYQQGLTLAIAQKVLEIAYPDGVPQKYLDAMAQVYKKMKGNMKAVFHNLRKDTDYGTIVSAGNDFGNHSQYNDHIVQYGFPLYALTSMKNYADRYAPHDQFFRSPIDGMRYSGMQMGDLLAADIGETSSNAGNPANRNFDVFNSHSWISGTQGYADGNNTESQSEAVFGSLAIAAWLRKTQPGSLQARVAQTRWAMEVQGLNTYFHVDGNNSAYKKVSPEFVARKMDGSIPPVVSNLFENKVTSDTFWGYEWDRQMACEFMPAGANTMDSYLNNTSVGYQKLAADYVLKNWSNFDKSNKIQSVLIAVVAKVYPDEALRLIDDVNRRGMMDDGTNGFILTAIAHYAKNKQRQ